MSLTSMMLNLNMSSSSSGKESGYLRLPVLPKDENQFVIWKLKVETTIKGAGLIEVLQYDEKELEEIDVSAVEVE